MISSWNQGRVSGLIEMNISIAPQKFYITAAVLFIAIASFSVLHLTKDISAPIIMALLLGIVLTPLSELWERLHIPSPIAALLSVLVALSFISVLVILVEPYVTQVINQAPRIWEEMRSTILEIQRLLRGIEEATEEVANALDDNAAEEQDDAMSFPSVADALFLAPQFAGQFLIFTGTLYFYLLSRPQIYQWIDRNFEHLARADLRCASKLVARYVLTISAINAGLGVCVAIAMYLIGMPTPVLWGLLAFSLNFILYLGPVMLGTGLLVAGVVLFDGAASLLPPLVYLGINAIEAQFVTPTLVGRSLAVNPLLIFLSLVFWLWLWGPVGAIVAIPLLIWCTTIFDRATTIEADPRSQAALP